MEGSSATHPYTCIGCSLAFSSAEAQREHYASELHRYNAKRRVAGLPPVTADLFEEKIAERVVPEEEDDDKRPACKACRKTFATIATQNTHMQSKKHKENVFRLASEVKVPSAATEGKEKSAEVDTSDLAEPANKEEEVDTNMEEASPVPSTSTAPPASTEETNVPFESSGDPKLDLLVARRIQSSPPIPVTTCLFCTTPSATAEANAAHMRSIHSFVIPEREYLVDLEGLLRRLGEEVGTWNVCVCCGKGYGGNINLDEGAETRSPEELRKRASKGVEAVRAHMQSKSHCRLRYDTEDQRLELADFYDFRPSYPDYVSKADRRAAKAAAEGWEDDEDADEDGAEVVYESGDDSEDDSDDDGVPESEITYGDSSYELVLPSGIRIGHRAHRQIYKQNLLPHLGQNPFKPSAHSSPHTAYKPSPHSQALLQLVPTMRKDKSHTRPIYDAGLIPAKGAGFGGNGDVIRAQNKGEAKHAGKATREFTELKLRAKQEFVRGIKANSQKHYRDHLLQ